MDINATLLVEMLIFLAFLLLTKHFVWSRIIEVLDERRKIVAEGLRQADQAKREQENNKAEMEKMLRESSQKAHSIIHEAKLEAQCLLDQTKQACSDKLSQHEKELEALTTQMKRKAQSQIQKQMLTLATEVCKKALNDALDTKTSQKIIQKQIGEAI